MTRPVSVVIPVFNGARTIGRLVETLIDHYADRYALEIVLVDDGSADESSDVCSALTGSHPGVVRFLQLSRNFGEHAAVMAGLRHTAGDAVVVMDDDFQNPPEEIGKLVEALFAGGHDVVYGQYESRGYGWFRNLGGWFNDRVASLMLRKPKGLYLSSLKCMNRFLVDEVCRYSGPFPYIDGLVLRVTRNVGTVLCAHREREVGTSGYSLRKLVVVWLNMFTNFSILPLRLAVVVGFAFALLGGVLSLGVVIEKLLIPDTQIGWPSTVITIMIFAGIQLMVLGLIGEYLGRLFLSDNQTPQFVIRRARGFESDAPDESVEKRQHLA